MTTDAILIVEDEKDLRDVYSLILKHQGYEVFASANGRDGVVEFEARKPKLVLLDIFMPIMDGKAFLKQINIKNDPAVKVVVCSNTSDNKLMNEMIQLGADKVVTKANIDPNGLLALVKPYMS